MYLDTHHKEPTWWLEASYRKLAQLGSVCMNRNSNSSRRHSLRSWKQIWGGEKEEQTPRSHLPRKALDSLERDPGSGQPCWPCPGAAPSLLSHETAYLVPDVLAQALALVQGDPSNQLHA